MEDIRANGFTAWTGNCHAGGQHGASLKTTNACGESAASRAPPSTPKVPAAASRLEQLAETLIAFYDDVAAQGDDEVVEDNAERLTALISPLLERRPDAHEDDQSPLTREFLSQPSSEFLIRHTGPYTAPILPSTEQFAPSDDPDSNPDIRSSAISHTAPPVKTGSQPFHFESASDSRGLGGSGRNLVATEEVVLRSMNLESSSSSLLHMPVQSRRGDTSSNRKASSYPHCGEHSQSAGASTRPVQQSAMPRNGISHIVTAPLCKQHKHSPATNFSMSPPRRYKSSPNKEQFALSPYDHTPRTASDPERRVSHKLQRLSLFKLIERCDRARRSPRLPALLPKQRVSLAMPSTPRKRAPVALDALVSSLPMLGTPR